MVVPPPLLEDTTIKIGLREGVVNILNKIDPQMLPQLHKNARMSHTT